MKYAYDKIHDICRVFSNQICKVLYQQLPFICLLLLLNLCLMLLDLSTILKNLPGLKQYFADFCNKNSQFLIDDDIVRPEKLNFLLFQENSFSMSYSRSYELIVFNGSYIPKYFFFSGTQLKFSRQLHCNFLSLAHILHLLRS